jgi:ubiquinone/menaquinone biosynthesis C-methylase UbiE
MDNREKITKRFLYTKLAKYYDYLTPKTTEEECLFLDKVFKKLGKGKVKSILDLGCGTGRHAALLQKMGYNVTGIDLSTQMLGMARKNSPNSTFLEMDFCSPKFKKDAFDASICMWSTIGYISSKEKFGEFIKNVAKITKEILVLTSTNHEADNFQTDEVDEKVTPIPQGKIKVEIKRHYNKATGVREEKYKYSIFEGDKITHLTDSNELKLWKVQELEKLLTPNFKILKIYGGYSEEASFKKDESSKKIIIAAKINGN